MDISGAVGLPEFADGHGWAIEVHIADGVIVQLFAKLVIPTTTYTSRIRTQSEMSRKPKWEKTFADPGSRFIVYCFQNLHSLQINYVEKKLGCDDLTRIES
jgi:hypothetical protein